MTERNTRVRASQIIDILPEDLNATNVIGTGMDGYVPTYDVATGKFTWVAQGGGAILGDEPTGFLTRTTSTISFNDGTRILTIEPAVTGGSFTYYIDGTEYVKSTAQTVEITDTEGIWYIYFEGATLTATQTFSADIILAKGYVCALYWNATNNLAIYLGEERHGLVMDGITHKYLHQTRGTQYISGLLIDNITTDGSGALDAHAQIGITNGVIADEDIEITITDDTPQALETVAQIPVYYKDGASGYWRKSTATNFPVKSYSGGSGRLAYNQFTGGAWQQTEVADGGYVYCHIFATNDLNNPIISVQGQNTYTSLITMRENASAEISSLVTAGMPFQEFVLIASIIYQTNNTYSNTVKARTRKTSGDDYLDWRFDEITPVSTTITDHSNLSGLTDPDHPASAIYTDITNFDNFLSSADEDVQKALETLDNLKIYPLDLEATNSPSTDLIPKYDFSTGKFTWVSQAGLSVNDVDDFTIKYENSKLKVADRIELNTMLLAFRLAESDSMTKHSMVDGIEDVFEDETGVDTGASTGEQYDGTNDLYQPVQASSLEIDYLEYANDSLAQANWVTSSPGGRDEYTKLLLHANENSGQKAIIDSGNTGHAVSQNGNAKLFSGVYGKGACYFDGTGDYLTVPDNSDWNRTSDFTIDFWAYIIAHDGGSITTFCGQGDEATLNNRWRIRYNAGTLDYEAYNITTQSVYMQRTWTVTLSKWYHVAVVRSGTNYYMFVNGVQLGTTYVDSDTPGDCASALSIGRGAGGTDYRYMNGYMNEFRFSNTARWTSNFTLSSYEYSSDSYTKLLLHLYSDFTDSGSVGYTVTAYGDASLRGGKFGNAGLDVTVSGAYLSVPDHTDWDFGTGDWTVECWMCHHIPPSGTEIVISIGGASGMEMFITPQLGFWFVGNSVTKGTTTLLKGIWYHLAIVRTGNNIKCFVNGTQEGTDWNATGISMSCSSAPTIGNRTGSWQTTAYLDEVRISNSARYTTTFTPSSSEFTSDSNTKLLLHCNTVDSSISPHPISAYGDAQVIQGKFNQAGIFNGTSSYLSVPDHEDFNYGSNTFTIDFWIYPFTDLNSGSHVLYFEGTSASAVTAIEIYNSGYVRFYNYNGSTIVSCASSSAYAWESNKWYHIAVVRGWGGNANDWAICVNGIAVGTVTDSDTLTNWSSGVKFGSGVHSGGATVYFNGLIDEIRISNIARWTTTFTPSTSAYVSDSNTKLLLHLDNNVTDSGNTVHTITNNNVGFIPKFTAGCYKFDGTGDYLQMPIMHPDWDFGTGDFTIDFWVNFSALTSHRSLIDMGYSGANGIRLLWYNTNNLQVGIGASTAYYFAWTPSLDTWYHVAVSRSGTNLRAFINGTQIGSTQTDSANIINIVETRIGVDVVSTYYFQGYIDEVRISKGIARWTTTFTSPTQEYADGDLQDYSEATIKNQGSYSLKGVALQTTSLNAYLRKTLSPTKNLSTSDSIKFDIRSSRTGQNLQMRIHDSGGTISTYNITINSANTWETKTWDISGITGTDRDAIDYIEIQVTNADSADTFYLDNVYAYTNSQNMSLQSISYTAEAQPDTGRIVLFEEDVDSITVNTDIKAYLSRDGGTTWTQITLIDEGDYENNKRILTGTAVISSQPVGTSVKWKSTTHNNKNLKLHGVGILWD